MGLLESVPAKLLAQVQVAPCKVSRLRKWIRIWWKPPLLIPPHPGTALPGPPFSPLQAFPILLCPCTLGRLRVVNSHNILTLSLQTCPQYYENPHKEIWWRGKQQRITPCIRSSPTHFPTIEYQIQTTIGSQLFLCKHVFKISILIIWWSSSCWFYGCFIAVLHALLFYSFVMPVVLFSVMF